MCTSVLQHLEEEDVVVGFRCLFNDDGLVLPLHWYCYESQLVCVHYHYLDHILLLSVVNLVFQQNITSKNKISETKKSD